MKTRAAQLVIVGLLLLPLLGVVRLIFFNATQDFSNLDQLIDLKALIHSLVLAIVSSIVTVTIGFFGGIGIAGSRHRHIFEAIAIAPSMLPTLFVLVALLGVVSPFPFGWIGSVLGVVAITVGIISVGLSYAILEKTKGLSEAALVMGVSQTKFIFKVVLPLLRKDMIGAAALVFACAFSSFAIPFVLGAGQVRTLEFAIYQSAFQDQNYLPALTMSLLQYGLLILFATKGSLFKEDFNFQSIRLEMLENSFFKWLAVLPMILLIMGAMTSLTMSFSELTSLLLDSHLLVQALVGTIVLSLAVGVLTVCMFKLSAIVYSNKWLEALTLGFQSPSTVMLSIGLWGLVLLPVSQMSVWLSGFLTAIALLISYYCVLYRLSWSGRLQQLSLQIEVAEVLGANKSAIVNNIVWPQMKPYAYRLGGFTAFWSAGDFTFSTLLSGQDWNLSLVAESYLSFYRVHLAMALVIFITFIGAIFYFIFRRLGSVHYQGD